MLLLHSLIWDWRTVIIPTRWLPVYNVDGALELLPLRHLPCSVVNKWHGASAKRNKCPPLGSEVFQGLGGLGCRIWGHGSGLWRGGSSSLRVKRA